MNGGWFRYGFSVLLVVPFLGGGLLSQRATLSQLVAESERAGYKTGVAVLDLQTGRFLFRNRSTQAFIPASNQKILTVAAALWGLGSKFRFRTTFKLRDGFLEVHPGGDPNWLTGSAHDPKKIFAKVAQALRDRGVTRLQGVTRLPGFFRGAARPDGWPKDQLDRLYCAPTDGLVLDAASFTARISPGAGLAKIELLSPPASVVFRSGIKMTSKRKKGYSYWISQGGGGFQGHGEFFTGARAVTVRGVVQQPGWMFEQTLRTVLSKHGIRIATANGSKRSLAKSVAVAPTGEDVYVHVSTLRESLSPILRDSSNFHAEQILRVLGTRRRGDGSFSGGCKVVRSQLGSRMKLPTILKIADGSGLSRINQVSPRLLVDVIHKLCVGPHASLFKGSLAQGGVSGTLSKRFAKAASVGKAVRAKTGTINGVKALSGIVRSKSGKTRLFSILMNRRKGISTRGASDLQERMVRVMYQMR
jgi:D-alanyl-D-alanine carboxypeptidase/D-alanyl-D-alanine-endopeptidase (penicillin-binding protein 4)